MQNLHLVISALLLAGSSFHVEAVPVTGRGTAVMNHKKQVYSEVTPASLATTFNFKVGVDIDDTFARILVSLSRDQRQGGIYLQMSNIFLMEMVKRNIAKDFVEAWRSMCYIVNKDREYRADGLTKTVDELITEASDTSYALDVHPELREVFRGLAPYISATIEGSEEAAKSLSSELGKQLGYGGLKELNHAQKMDILESTSAELHWWADIGLGSLIKTGRFED